MSGSLQQYTEAATSDGEIIPVQVFQPGALEAQTRAEVDVAIATAKRYPRDIQRSLNAVKSLALISPEVAESCFYALPPRSSGQKTIDKRLAASDSLSAGFDKRDQNSKPIIGPSTRLAEIIRSAWGNIRVVSRVTDIGDRFVTVQSVCQDMETNNTYGAEIKRQIWGRNGRYSDAMIATVAAAGIKITERNATFAVVPRALWEGVYVSCKKLAIGDGKSIVESRKKFLAWASELGVSQQEVFALLGVQGEASINLDHLQMLAGIRTALSENLTTVDEVFRPNKPEEGPESANQKLLDALKSKKPTGDKSAPADPPFGTPQPRDHGASAPSPAPDSPKAAEPVKPQQSAKSPFETWLEPILASFNQQLLAANPGSKPMPVHQVINGVIRVGLDTGDVIKNEWVNTNGKRDPVKSLACLDNLLRNDPDWIAGATIDYLKAKLPTFGPQEPPSPRKSPSREPGDADDNLDDLEGVS